MAEESIRRKLTTILAADVAGYSRLAAADEEATLRTLKSHRDIIDRLIARHDGRIFGAAGDSVVAEFGSAVEAVRAAIAIQEELRARNGDLPDDRRMDFRIGVNVGDVMVDGDNLYGDGVNVAARLEGLAEPGGICVSGSTFDQVKNRLSVSFEDLGPQSVKNIPDPVPTFRITAAPVSVAAPTRTRPRWRGPAIVAAVVIAVAVAGGLAWWHPWAPTSGPASAQRTSPSLPGDLSLVVLPFDYLGGQPDEAYLADVITDQLTTYLSRIPDTFVIARNTAFTYRGKAVNVKHIGEELGVKYVLEGSVQPSGGRVRVNAQLIDVESGAHIWADKFDQSAGDPLQSQDDIVTRVARALHIELSTVEAARLDRPAAKDADAEVLAVRCEAKFTAARPFSDEWRGSFALCEQALAKDPGNVRALGILAINHASLVATGQSTDRGRDIERATDLATRALSADPNYYLAHLGLGWARVVQGRHEEAIIEGQRTLALNPSAVIAYIIMSGSSLYVDPAKTIEWARKAIRVSPRDHFLYAYYAFTGRAYFILGQTDKAIEWLRKSVAHNQTFPQSRLHLAAVLGAAGRVAEAKEELAAYLSFRRTRSRTIAEWNKELRTKNPAYVATFARLTEGLRRAGMPETAPEETKAPPLSIVVLPFDFLGADLSEAYLADVITDQLTTYLARIPGTFVIARNTAFTYQGRAVDVKQIAKDLGVRYVLEGSLYPAGDRVRINAQLIDAGMGAHMWAETFDHAAADRLQLQDDIVTRVARALHFQLSAVEAARLEQPGTGDPDADSLAIRCEATVLRWSPGSPRSKAAYPLCERALETDPENVRALSILAVRYGYLVATGQSTDRPGDIKRNRELAMRAMAAGPNYYLANWAKSYMHTVAVENDLTIVAAQRALELNPSYIIPYLNLSAAGLYSGQPAKTIEWSSKAIRLSPRDPVGWSFYMFVGRGHFMLGHYEEAIDWLRKAVALNPNFPQSQVHLTAALGYAGREAEASEALAAYLANRRTRSRTIAQWKKELRTDNPAYVATFERLTEGLRKAGMPES